MTHGAFPDPVEANGLGKPAGEDPTKRTGTFPVGVHPIAYTLSDAFGNVHPEECLFTVEVKQKAHPVVVTCPADAEVRTLPEAGFGVPCWAPPTAKQGPKDLPPSHITYLHGIRPGLPFPYGVTVVTVKAVGEITGTRTLEEEQSDECTFKVTVKDPQRPDVDGRKYRCGTAVAGEAEPYAVCGGTDLVVSMHAEYAETGGYDLGGT